MPTRETRTVRNDELFARLRDQLDDDEWKLVAILLQLLQYEALFDPRMEWGPPFRWLTILSRLLDRRSPSSPQVAELLSRIQNIAESEKPHKASAFDTFRPNELEKLALFTGTLNSISAVRGEIIDANLVVHRFQTQNFHRDLLALRYYLGEADFAFLIKHMWTSPEEANFSWRDNVKLWLSRRLICDVDCISKPGPW